MSESSSFPVGGILIWPSYRTARMSRLWSGSPFTITGVPAAPRRKPFGAREIEAGHLHGIAMAGAASFKQERADPPLKELLALEALRPPQEMREGSKNADPHPKKIPVACTKRFTNPFEPRAS